MEIHRCDVAGCHIAVVRDFSVLEYDTM